MRSPQAPRSLPRRASPTLRSASIWRRALVQIARLLVLACALQLSSGAHVLVDLVSGAATPCIDTSDCADDGADERGCPLDCSDCACPHGRLPSLPPALAPILPSPIAWEISAPWAPYLSGAPPSPPLASLDRPPRA